MARKKRTELQNKRGVFEKEPGSNVWWIRYTDGAGKYKREKVGRHSDAVSLYQKRKTEARLGVKMPENIRHKGVTFKDLADSILSYVEQKRYKDQRNVVQRVNRLCEDFGAMEASKLLPEDISTWLSKNTKTPATSNRYKAAFSLIYREGVRNRKVSTNPARLVAPARENNARIRWLHHAERKRLFAVMEKHYPDYLPELIISLDTGMRLSEQYGLTWADVDMRTGVIRLSETKNGLARDIPMSKDVKAAFTQLKPGKPHARVFSNAAPHDWWDDARDRAKLDGYVWHCNRHTFCTVLTEKGVPLKVIQKLAGHKTIAMTARYAKATDSALADAIALL
jgi:site-specific recombinase XerD